MKQFPKNFFWGETGMGPSRKAGEASFRGGVAQIFWEKIKYLKTKVARGQANVFQKIMCDRGYPIK